MCTVVSLTLKGSQNPILYANYFIQSLWEEKKPTKITLELALFSLSLELHLTLSKVEK
jgi:hypothetical protein